MLIAQHGEAATEQIVRGWVANLATPPFANDTRLMEAIAAGQCDVGIVNTYYFGRLQRDRPDLPLKLFWADQAGEGVHVNVSGAGVTAHAPRARKRRKFLEWLSQPEAQALFAGAESRVPGESRREAGRARRCVGRLQGERAERRQGRRTPGRGGSPDGSRRLPLISHMAQPVSRRAESRGALRRARRSRVVRSGLAQPACARAAAGHRAECSR